MRFLRVGFLIFGAAVFGYISFTFGQQWLSVLYNGLPDREKAVSNQFAQLAVILAGVGVGAWVGSSIARLLERSVGAWDQMHSGDKVNIFIGVLFGVVITVPFMFMFNSQGVTSGTLLSIAMMVFLSAIAVYAMRSMEDVLPWSKNFGRGKRSNFKILDTSVIIDGRIYDVARTGFVDGQLYLPKFVLNELQYIADHSDPLRRQRGRRGLEVLKQIQAKFPLEVGSQDRLAPEASDGVDGRLVRLARALGADLITNDHNLNRVADLQDVRVLNLNDLSVSLRPMVLPGEPLEVVVMKEGSQFGQGIGYLDDGTMVVIEGGKRALGTEVAVIVNQVHQTERGKMIFAELPPEEGEDAEVDPRKSPKRGK